MSFNFKVKEKKIDKNKNKISETLDSKHLDVLKDIEAMNNKLPILEKQLNDLLNKLVSVNNQIESNKTELNLTHLNILEDTNYIDRYDLEEKVKSVNHEIDNIKNNKHLNDYFNKTGHLLYYYYDGNKTLENEYKIRKNTSNEEDEEQSNDSTISTEEFMNEVVFGETQQNKKTKITDFIEKEDGFEKAELYDKYIKLIKDQTFIQKDIFTKKNKAGQSAICIKCNIPLNLVYSEGLQVCSKCGRTEYILIDSEKPSFREPPPEVSYFAYKRINHFNEWLSQFQAKESTEIPSDIYQLILLEMKKERINDLNRVTPQKIREYLKKLKLNKYYEHVPHILNKLNNKKVPLIAKETEEKLRHMFKEIQAPFMKVCPPNRKNFLSYSYVLHKFVELLGLDHLKDCFPLLKSREKLHQQDQIWKEICRELNWMYIKSI